MDKINWRIIWLEKNIGSYYDYNNWIKYISRNWERERERETGYNENEIDPKNVYLVET